MSSSLVYGIGDSSVNPSVYHTILVTSQVSYKYAWIRAPLMLTLVTTGNYVLVIAILAVYAMYVSIILPAASRDVNL